jgi:hypothetical protein
MEKRNLKKLNFNYDLGGLSSYVDQLSPDIISEAVLTPISVKYLNVIPGIKGTQNVNLLSETLSVQTGTTCGFSDAGDVTFTVAPITVQSLKVNQSLCLEELNTLWLGQYLSSGSYNEQAPFEQAILDLQTKQVKRYNEDLIWQATSGSSSFSGFLEIFANANSSIGFTVLTGQTALCSVTGSSSVEKAYNILAQVDNIINALDRNIFQRDDVKIYMSLSQFKCYLTAIRNVNNFHFTEPTLGQVYSTFHPQTNFEVVGCPGFGSSNKIIAGPQQYMLYGTDLMSDEDGYRAWWSQDFQEVRMIVNWKIGVTAAFPQFFVTNGIA